MRPSPRVLIVSAAHLCRNPRVHKEAAALARSGYRVSVLTLSNHPRFEALDRDLVRTAAFERLVIDHLTPGPARWRGWLDRAETRVCRTLVRRFGLESPAALGPARRLLARAAGIEADLTIVHCEAPAWVGLRLLARGRTVAADFEDWYSEDLPPGNRGWRPLALLRRVERELLQKASYTTTPSFAMAAAMQERYGGRRPDVIGNAFPLGPAPDPGAIGDAPSFLWFSQTLGPGRGLEAFLDAWTRTRHPSRVVLVGEPAGNEDGVLLDRIPAARRTSVTLLKPVPPGQLPALIARHDIGLALEPASPANKDLTISNKILQYLNAGLAVVATDTAGQREVLSRDPAAGVMIDFRDAAGAAAALDGLLARREALGDRRRAARRLAEDVYCWEREVPKLLALVASAIGGSRPA